VKAKLAALAIAAVNAGRPKATADPRCPADALKNAAQPTGANAIDGAQNGTGRLVAACDLPYSQNLVTGTGSFAPLPSQNISFWSMPLETR
jgi:hypothetical protein